MTDARVRIEIELVSPDNWYGKLYVDGEQKAGSGRMSDPADVATWLYEDAVRAAASLPRPQSPKEES